MRLLSFCEGERTIAFQKLAFPSFWPLHASPHLMAHGSSLVGHINADNVSTVHTYCHMLGAKTSAENPSSNLFPNISCSTVVYYIIIYYSILYYSLLWSGRAPRSPWRCPAPRRSTRASPEWAIYIYIYTYVNTFNILLNGAQLLVDRHEPRWAVIFIPIPLPEKGSTNFLLYYLALHIC